MGIEKGAMKQPPSACYCLSDENPSCTPSQLRKRIGASGVVCLIALDSLLKKCLGGLDIIIQKILNQRGENFILVIADMDISLRPEIGNIQNHQIRTSVCQHMI